jgi:hypothetical protein
MKQQESLQKIDGLAGSSEAGGVFPLLLKWDYFNPFDQNKEGKAFSGG